MFKYIYCVYSASESSLQILLKAFPIHYFLAAPKKYVCKRAPDWVYLCKYGFRKLRLIDEEIYTQQLSVVCMQTSHDSLSELTISQQANIDKSILESTQSVLFQPVAPIWQSSLKQVSINRLGDRIYKVRIQNKIHIYDTPIFLASFAISKIILLDITFTLR